MHWVDMEWLWGYDVLPGSTEDMLKYCRELGVKGNVNFDGIGYEKMAAEAPEQLAFLRKAIAEGTIEVVGASYGQPYGLFHGGESNVRQRIYGVRTAMRTLGTRPRTFWEEEFDFYPQLPQMLAGCGFTGASLYFQWTWHTPEIPMEQEPVVAWEGVDGTRIPTATRNRMNLHQWPEDFRILLDELAANPPEESDVPPLVLQWLELMPTQDWMCRSELMAPMLRELQQDPRFEIIATTLGEYLAKYQGKKLPVRAYKLDDVWHGMTLGKNGDRHPRLSARAEKEIQVAETAGAILGLFGRPYDPWDVYKTWEYEECWRTLLAAQHHDNHECEGLCGHVASAQFEYVRSLLTYNNPLNALARRVGPVEGKSLLFNESGFAITSVNVKVPAMGYLVASPELDEITWSIDGDLATFDGLGWIVQVDLKTAQIISLKTPSHEVRNVTPFVEIANREATYGIVRKAPNSPRIDGPSLTIELGPSPGAAISFCPDPESGHLWVQVRTKTFDKDSLIEPGYAGATNVRWEFSNPIETIKTDSPYAVQMVGPGSSGRRKYPEGDWMTSPQWFEEVDNGFTSQSFTNIKLEGLATQFLICHAGNQQWFRETESVRNVILARDPWDGDNGHKWGYSSYALYLHDGISNAEMVRRSATSKGMCQSNWITGSYYPASKRSLPKKSEIASPPLPSDFSAVTVHAENVLATAFYREQSSHSGKDLPNYAAKHFSHPYILRLVEYNGESGEVEVTLPGPIAAAYKTNLLGEFVEEVPITPGDSSLLTPEVDLLKPFGIEAARIKLHMRPHEIATIYLDIVPGRKRFRDLDAKREIWATVHRE